MGYLLKRADRDVILSRLYPAIFIHRHPATFRHIFYCQVQRIPQSADTLGNLSYLFVHSVIMLVFAKNTKDSDTKRQKHKKKVSE